MTSLGFRGRSSKRGDLADAQSPRLLLMKLRRWDWAPSLAAAALACATNRGDFHAAEADERFSALKRFSQLTAACPIRPRR